jgi:hypothetical protein
MITGITSHKLDLIVGNDTLIPFKIGVNGVTKLVDINGTVHNNSNDIVPSSAITYIYYTIDNINYVTKYSKPSGNIFDKKGRQQYSLDLVYPTTFSTNYSGYDFTTTYLSGGTHDVKEESKMGLIFEPKVVDNLFIERQELAVFERHSRLAEIINITNLGEYRNGYYYIKQD